MENFLVDTRRAGKQASKQVDFSSQTDTRHTFGYLFQQCMLYFSSWANVIRFLVYLLVCLVCSETMVLKNFFSRKNWVGNEVAGMKIAFYHFWPYLDSHFGCEKPQIWNFLNRILIFNPLERLYYYQVCDLKTSKINTFCYFWPKMDKNFVIVSFKYSVSS